MVGLCPVILGLISVGGGEVLRASVQGILYQHTVATCLPGGRPLLNLPPDFVGCGDMTGLLLDHFLKDNESLLVPQYIPHPMQLFHQGHQKASPHLPTWRIIAPGGHDQEVTTPPPTSLIVHGLT